MKTHEFVSCDRKDCAELDYGHHCAVCGCRRLSISHTKVDERTTE